MFVPSPCSPPSTLPPSNQTELHAETIDPLPTPSPAPATALHHPTNQPSALPLSAAELAAVQQAVLIAGRYCRVLRRRKKPGGAVAPTVTEHQVTAVVQQAIAAAAETYGTRAAEEWAAGFTFPEAARTTDAALFAECNNDFNAFCLRKQALIAHDRLNEERIARAIPRAALQDKKDWRRLHLIARGIHIAVPPGFCPDARRPPLRRKYAEEVPHAVNKLLYTQWLKGTVALLPTELAATIPGIHWSFQHWAPKMKKVFGRVICDVSKAGVGAMPLNGNSKEGMAWLRDQLETCWGKIRHPTITDIALMIWRACTRYGKDQVELWKMDLASAFNLMNFAPGSAKLLAFELTEGMTAIHTTGMFGWAGTPYVFQVIPRALCSVISRLLYGEALMYVDDLLGASHERDTSQDLQSASGTCKALLGNGSVAEDKTERGKRMDMIGWHIDVPAMLVTISEKNMLKVIYVFFCIDITRTIQLKEAERLASMASRYAMLCRQMKPFTRALHDTVASFHEDRLARRRLSVLAQSDIVMWRAFLCLLHFESQSYARPLASFAPRPPTVLFEYDASLSGFGVGVSAWDRGTNKFVLLLYSGLIAPFPVTSDSSFQNTNEYMAVLLGLLLIRQTGCVAPGFAYNIIGDNTTSLAWVRDERVSSTLARRANIGFSLVSVELDAYPCDVSHIAGVDNVVYDGLSRGKTGVGVGLPPEKELQLSPTDMAVQFVVLCNPNIDIGSAEDHTQLSVDFLDLLNQPTAAIAQQSLSSL